MLSRLSAGRGLQSSAASCESPKNISASLGLAAQTELSWPGISFPEGRMRRLLFLNGIKAVEAAARSGSLARAGTQLQGSAAALIPMLPLLTQRLRRVLVWRKTDPAALAIAG